MPATRAQVQHAEQQRQQRALFRALALGDAREAAALLARIRSPAALSLEILGLTAMHVAAAACPALLPALAAAGAPLDGALSAVPALMPPAHVLLTIFETLDALDERQRRAMAVGFTPLACAAWVLSLDAAAELLRLGADPNACGYTAEGLPVTPLAAMLVSPGRPGLASMAGLLLGAGADPLAHGDASALRGACCMPIPRPLHAQCVLELVAEHLEEQRAARALRLADGEAAVQVMLAAAHTGMEALWRHAHRAALAAARRGWAPDAEDLAQVLLGAAAAGSAGIVAAALASRLPFDVAHTEGLGGRGLLAKAAAHGGSAEAVRLLHAAGARLSLRGLLYCLDCEAAPAALAALLACQRPRPPGSDGLDPVLEIYGVESAACPVARCVHAWVRHVMLEDGAGSAACQRGALLRLEALLAASYRPLTFSTDPQQAEEADPETPLALPEAGGAWNPLQQLLGPEPPPHRHTRRLGLVALQRGWSTAEHVLWPDAFKRAVRALLLAASQQPGSAAAAQGARWPCRRQRGGSGRGGAGAPAPCHLAALPQDVLLHIVGQAAFPMSAWMPVDEFGGLGSG